MQMPSHVTIIEVGPRDGLQNEKQFVPTEAKLAFIEALQKSGIKEMEMTSFVSPKWVPQMQDATDIVNHRAKDIHSIVLTPNEKGIERALDLNCQSLAVFVGVSNTFNKKNINKTTEESMQELIPLIHQLKSKNIYVRACISTAFHCPYEGKIDLIDTYMLCKQFVDAGVDELSVADTIGKANPSEVFQLFSLLKTQFPHTLLTAHFHDTFGLALANIFASLQVGIDRFDTSAGGLGGCPFAKGATGNVATEDVVYMLHEMNIETGISLSKLIDAIEIIRPHVSRELESRYYKRTKQAMSSSHS